jgi:hypothetical protein
MRLSGVALAATVSLLLAGCASADDGGPWVSLDEYSVETSAILGGGTTEVRNTGEFGHTLIVTDADGRVVASTDVLAPGGTTDLDLTLDPGTYQFTCRIVVELPDGEIVDHYAAGMDRRVTVD